MTFFVSKTTLSQNTTDYGVFVHVPKCAGSAIQAYLKKYHLNISRPYGSMNHHRSFCESIAFIERFRKKPKFAIIPWRNPLEWRLSIYNYAIRENPDISFMPLENKTFPKITFEQYIESLLDIRTCSSRELSRSELPWNTMWSWLVQPFYNDLMPDKIYLINSSFPVQHSIQKICELEFNFELSNQKSKSKNINQYTEKTERASLISKLPANLRKKMLLKDLGDLRFYLDLGLEMHTFTSQEWIQVSSEAIAQ